MPQRKGSNGPTPAGQLELAIGKVGDTCDFHFLVLHHLQQAMKFLDKSHTPVSEVYRDLITLKDGRDPGEYGIPPRERETGIRWSPSVVAA